MDSSEGLLSCAQQRGRGGELERGRERAVVRERGGKDGELKREGEEVERGGVREAQSRD